MAWNGSGTFTLSENFPADRDAGAPDHFIDADKVDNEFQNFKVGLQACLTRNGETLPSANTSWNSFKITSLGDATNATDALNRQTADARYVALAGSTATGAILIAQGTVSAPGLAVTGEADCGIYYIGANNLGFAIAGAKVLDIAAAGLSVTGRLSVTTDPDSGDDVGDRDYNDARYLEISSNLGDLGSASTARTNLGLGTIATQAASAVSITGGSVTGITDLAVADGGTGASTAANARTNLGIGTIATRAFTASTAAPSGGADGDVWFRYV